MRPELLELASRLAARGEGFALVTVVRREPPSSARVGDTALVTGSGEVHGWVGGGCTRSTLLRESLRAIADGEPRLLSLSRDPATEQRPGLVALLMTCKSGGTVDLYVEPVLPVPRVVVFGTTPAARTLVRIAHAMGYRVDVVDPEADGAGFPEATRVIPEVSPDAVPQGACVLIATMDERDLDAIEAVVPLMPAYLGVIASRKRFAELREALAARGVPRGVLDGIVAPAGLDIGARTPEEIALSVMAQIVERRRRPARTAPEPRESPPAGAPERGAGAPLSGDATAEARRGPAEKSAAPSPAPGSHLPPPAAGTAPPSAGAPREAIDPVCGMTVAIAGARHSAEVKGRMYYFCCPGCRTKFLADPARYPAPAHST